MSYIYHIHTTDKSGIYIGQTVQKSYNRPVEHFRSGYRGRGENILFQNFLKQHSFDEMIVEIYNAPDYGLDPKELDAFLLNWYQDYNVYEVKEGQNSIEANPKNKKKFDEAMRLNAAEILHTYYYQKHKIYGQVCALSMGGQQPVSFSKEGVVLSRDLSPDIVMSLIESSGQTKESLGQLQQIFNERFKQQARKNNLYLTIAMDWINNGGNNINKILQDFFINHLEIIIRHMQNDLKQGHTQYGYTIKWSKGHEFNFYGSGEQLRKPIDIVLKHFKNHKNRLETDCKGKSLEETIQLILDFIGQAFSHISIESFIKINIKDNFSTKNVVSYISSPNETNPEEVQNNLKRISYDYFRRIADKVKIEIQGIYNSKLANNNLFRMKLTKGEQQIEVLKIDTMTNLIREEYLSQGIRGSFITDYDHWLEFSRGMLTLYTKNNKSIFGYPMIWDEIDNIPLGILDTTVEMNDNTVVQPAYEFSPNTYSYIRTHETKNREDLIAY